MSFLAVALLLLAPQESPIAAEIRRAESFWRSGKTEEARAALERVRERAPSILLPLLILAHVDGVESEELKRFVPEARTRAVLLQNAPMEGEDFVPLERPAIVLASLGDVDRAIREYRAVAEVDPRNLDLHRHLGSAFFKASRNVEAVEAFERAVAIEPEDAGSWGQLGSSRLRLQWWDKAIEAFDKARALEGDKPGGLFALGYAWERKPDFEKALDFYERASELSPSWAQPPYRRGRTLLKLDRRDDAERELKRALELDPNLAEARCFLGALYLENRDLVAATRELELSVSQSPRYAKAHFYLGQAYLRAGRREEAQAALARFEQITREIGDVDPP
ncbi:MAG TPA: tetratricopeptide repeat protein [Vicinamibacteria bacterium]|nr:tetratricopeptide repeat protein [Vicinamibacteria bacterium]